MIKIFLRMFFMTAGLFFLGLLFGNLTHMGLRLALADAAVKGILFGIGLSAVLGTLHMIKARQAAGENPGADIYALKQVREVRTRLPYDRVFSMMRHYLGEVAGFTVTRDDPEKGLLEGRSKMNFMTFGNKLSVLVARTETGAVHATITAKPLISTTLADYGESLKTADAAADYLRAGEQA